MKPAGRAATPRMTILSHDHQRMLFQIVQSAQFPGSMAEKAISLRQAIQRAAIAGEQPREPDAADDLEAEVAMDVDAGGVE